MHSRPREIDKNFGENNNTVHMIRTCSVANK